MSRIAINILSGRSGGAVAYIKHLIPRLSAELDKARISTTVVGTQQQLAALEHCKSIDRFLAPLKDHSTSERIIWERRNLPRVIDELDAKLAFTPYQILHASTRATDVVMVRNMEPFFFHRYRYSLYGWIRNAALRFATIRTIRKADHVVCVSNFVANCMQRFRIPQNQITTIYHGRDDSFQSNQPQRVEPFFFVCGSMLPYRRCEDVIHAYERYAIGGNQTNLIIAGIGSEPGYIAKLQTLISNLGMTDKIRLAGQLSRDEVRDHFQRCRAFIAATEIEACPNTVIEALTSGCTIIASRTPPLPEVLDNGALYYEPRNISELSQLMQQVDIESSVSLNLPSLARARSDFFSWDSCALETATLLKSLM